MMGNRRAPAATIMAHKQRIVGIPPLCSISCNVNSMHERRALPRTRQARANHDLRTHPHIKQHHCLSFFFAGVISGGGAGSGAGIGGGGGGICVLRGLLASPMPGV